MSTAQPAPTEENRRLQVFLCHSSGDKQFARDLYSRLKTDGFAPWLDERELLPGQRWQDEIPAAVRRSDVVIVCLSRKSVNKEGYLQREIRDALYVAEEKPEGTIFIIPARIEDVEVPKRLSEWQWANLFSENGYPLLIAALNRRAQTLGIRQSSSQDILRKKTIDSEGMPKERVNQQSPESDTKPKHVEVSRLEESQPIPVGDGTAQILPSVWPTLVKLKKGPSGSRYKKWLYAVPIVILIIITTMIVARSNQSEQLLSQSTMRSTAAPTPDFASNPGPVTVPASNAGQLVWQGDVNGPQLITIDGDHSDIGKLEGSLPGVPCIIELMNGQGASIASIPGPRNGYQRLILRVTGHGHLRVVIRWNKE